MEANTHVAVTITSTLPLSFNQYAFKFIKCELVLIITGERAKRKMESAAGLLVPGCYSV